MEPLTSLEIAHRRIIESMRLAHGRGEIQANGKIFYVVYDDVLDVVQAVEMVMLKLTGKLLTPKFRPAIRNRKALEPDKFFVGDVSLYDGALGEAPVEATQVCDVTGRLLTTHYMHCSIAGNRWDNWFCRLDELVKCLYIVVREAQGDPYVPKVMVAAHA